MLTCLFVGVLTANNIYRHLDHYTRPHLQVHILRILLVTPIIAFFSFLALAANDIRFPLSVLRDMWEAVVVYSFLMLILEYMGGEHLCLNSIISGDGRECGAGMGKMGDHGEYSALSMIRRAAMLIDSISVAPARRITKQLEFYLVAGHDHVNPAELVRTGILLELRTTILNCRCSEEENSVVASNAVHVVERR